MYKLVTVACLVAIAAVMTAALCVKGGGGSAEFTFNNGPEVNSLDPHRISWKHDIRIANALFEGLMAFKVDPPTEGESLGRLGLTPGVAERYGVSPDGRTYTFHLRQDACWTNGRPVTAGDFLWSWKRVMTPLTGADYVGMMFLIAGARQYYDDLSAGRDASFDSVGLKAPDDRTLVVQLTAPTGYFLDLTAFPPFFPVYRPLLESTPRATGQTVQGGIAAYDGAWTRPDRIVANGPFRLAEHRFKQEIVLERSDTYWDRANVRTGRIRALAIDDASAGLNAYESRRCDLIDTVPAGTARMYANLPADKRRADYHRVTAFGTYFYRFNCQPTAAGRPNPLADPRVRRALAMCIDRLDIVENVTGLRQPPAATLIPPGLKTSDLGFGISYLPVRQAGFGLSGDDLGLAGIRNPHSAIRNSSEPGHSSRDCEYIQPTGQSYDPEGAQKLLAEAGFPSPADLGEIRLMYNTNFSHQSIAERLASVWRRQLGVNVVLVPKDSSAFGQAMEQKQDKEWHLGRSTWFGDYRDPTTFLDMFISTDGNNDCGYANPAFDALMAEAAGTGDQQRRMEILHRAEKLAIVQDCAILPLYFYVEQYMIRPSVRGAWMNPMGYLLLKQIYVEK